MIIQNNSKCSCCPGEVEPTSFHLRCPSIPLTPVHFNHSNCHSKCNMALAKRGHKASISEVTPARARVMQLQEDAAFSAVLDAGWTCWPCVSRRSCIQQLFWHDFYMISPMIFLKRTNPYVKSYDITLVNLYHFNDILAPISQWDRWTQSHADLVSSAIKMSNIFWSDTCHIGRSPSQRSWTSWRRGTKLCGFEFFQFFSGDFCQDIDARRRRSVRDVASSKSRPIFCDSGPKVPPNFRSPDPPRLYHTLRRSTGPPCTTYFNQSFSSWIFLIFLVIWIIWELWEQWWSWEERILSQELAIHRSSWFLHVRPESAVGIDFCSPTHMLFPWWFTMIYPSKFQDIVGQATNCARWVQQVETYFDFWILLDVVSSELPRERLQVL